tara:strand:+ start:66 stop:806 length:741 start_codon:yes stop_codon:yes gene_type:complete
MGENFKFLIKKLFIVPIFFISLTSLADKINDARNFFIKGEYIKAINLCEKINTPESLILQSRIISIHSFFFKENEEAQDAYLKAYNIAKIVIKNNNTLSEGYVEAAHALGRYGQEVGVINAIALGVADKIKNYLSLAIKMDENNVIANMSIGIWHAEIINKAGKKLAKILYGASQDKARFYLNRTLELNNEQIGLLYEVARGFSLLGSNKDVELSKNLLSTLISKKNYAHMDSLYKIKAKKLLNKI